MEREAARGRQKSQDFGRGVTPENFSGVNGRAIDKVSSAIGLSRPTYAKAKKVVAFVEHL